MESPAPRYLKLGDEFTATLLRALGGKRFQLKSSAAPRGWNIELHTRRPELMEEGMSLNVWVARVTPIKELVLVHEGDFGRMPISPAMGKRYAVAVQALRNLEDVTADSLGEAKAMVSRIGTHNQADWLTVWKLLGEPDNGELVGMIRTIDSMREARRDDPEKLAKLHAELAEEHEQRLRNASFRLKLFA